jgi:hypothetical protein
MVSSISTTTRWQYRFTIPFAREVPPGHQDELAASLNRFPVRYQHTDTRTTQYLAPDAVDIDADRVRLDITLDEADPSPATVLGKAYAQIGTWHEAHAPVTLTEPTRAGGEQSVSLRTTAGIDADPDADPDADGTHYLVAYPEDPLSEMFVDAADAHLGADVDAGRGHLAIIGHDPHGLDDARGEALLDETLRRLPLDRLPDTDLRDRFTFPRRDLGTLAAVTDSTRAALADYARRQSPIPTEPPADDDAADATEVGL